MVVQEAWCARDIACDSISLEESYQHTYHTLPSSTPTSREPKPPRPACSSSRSTHSLLQPFFFFSGSELGLELEEIYLSSLCGRQERGGGSSILGVKYTGRAAGRSFKSTRLQVYSASSLLGELGLDLEEIHGGTASLLQPQASHIHLPRLALSCNALTH